MSLTKTVKNNTFDDCFTEVDHTESISTIRPGSMFFQERSRNNLRKQVILMRLCSRRSESCVNAEPLVPREPEMSLER